MVTPDEPRDLRDVRERVARRLSPCGCDAADCRHPVIDEGAWRLADAALAEVSAWLMTEAEAAEAACPQGQSCGDCTACQGAEWCASTAVVISGTCDGLPTLGHPESLLEELDEDSEEELAAVAAALWPGDEYLRGEEDR